MRHGGAAAAATKAGVCWCMLVHSGGEVRGHGTPLQNHTASHSASMRIEAVVSSSVHGICGTARLVEQIIADQIS